MAPDPEELQVVQEKDKRRKRLESRALRNSRPGRRGRSRSTRGNGRTYLKTRRNECGARLTFYCSPEVPNAERAGL